jgi:replicative DNA helicase
MATADRTARSKSGKAIAAEIFDRQPPCNLDAEKGVLGSVLLLPEVLDDLALILRCEDFYDEANGRLYSHMLALHEAGRPVEVTLLVDRLKGAGDYDLVGGAAYLYEVGTAVHHAASAAHYAGIVKDKAILRSLIHTSTDILRDAYDQAIPARDMLNRAEQKMFGILESDGGGKVSDIRSVLMEAMARIDKRMSGELAAAGIETGFTDLDVLTGGLHNGELVILAARPSMGKTALALNMAEHVALKSHVPVLFVSLEMSSLELADRMLCSIAEVDGNRLRNGHITQDERKRLVEKNAHLGEAPLFIDDSPSRTMTEIAAASRRLKRRGGLGLVVIDYLQLIEPDNPSDSRQEQVARIARRLKGLARELAIPVLCLAQLNRQAEVTRDNKPRLSHLRESGAIEQDADVVMFVHREEYYQTSEERRQEVAGQAQIIIAKQRNGPTGEVHLTWHHKYTRFRNAAHQRYDQFDAHNASPPGDFGGF